MTSDPMPGRYVIRGAEEGYDRLQVLSRSRWDDTARLLRRAGLKSGMTCLDVGCGSGAVTIEIGRVVGPDGLAVGMDLDEVKLSLARQVAAAEGLSNVEFRVQDVDGWDEATTYDLVYSRFLLQHLADPVSLLVRMWAAVGVGGTLVVEDADFDGSFCHPPNDAFDFFVRTYSATLAGRAGDATFGRKLPAAFSHAGIPAPEVDVVAFVHTGEARMMPYLTLEMSSDAIVAEGVSSRDDVATALEELRALSTDTTSLIGGPRVFQVWRQRQERD